MNRRISWLKFAILSVMSAFGLWASSMVLIIYDQLHQQLPGCSATGNSFWIFHFDCGAVLSSKYSTVYGIPLEIFAIVYFMSNVLLVCLIAFGSDSVFRVSKNVLFSWRFLGLPIVAYLVYVEAELVHAWCLYCTVMHIAIVVDFCVITYLLFIRHDIGEVRITRVRSKSEWERSRVGV